MWRMKKTQLYRDKSSRTVRVYHFFRSDSTTFCPFETVNNLSKLVFCSCVCERLVTIAESLIPKAPYGFPRLSLVIMYLMRHGFAE